MSEHQLSLHISYLSEELKAMTDLLAACPIDCPMIERIHDVIAVLRNDLHQLTQLPPPIQD
jgi:hypothetical protein